MILQDCDSFDTGILWDRASCIAGWTGRVLGPGVSSGRATGFVLGSVASCPTLQSRHMKWFRRERLNLSGRKNLGRTMKYPCCGITYVGCLPYPYHSPGSMTKRFFLYLSPNSLRYFFSLPPAHTPIWPTATNTNSTVLQLHETSAIPIQAMASNI